MPRTRCLTKISLGTDHAHLAVLASAVKLRLNFKNFKQMLINDDKKIKDIQQEFHQKFPYLKLEFYAGSHRAGESSPARERLDNERLLGEVRSVHNVGDLHIREEMSVSELEEQFMTKYGLNAQVFRRSGNLWLQTSATDSWALAEQNRKGGHSEELFKQKLE